MKTTTPTRRGLLAAAAALSVPVTARAAPPPPAAQPLTIRFATSYAGVHPMGRALRTVLAGFQRDYPGITIAFEETPGNDRQTRIKLDAASDRMPISSTTGGAQNEVNVERDVTGLRYISVRGNAR